jgi:hypothetical protein
MIKDAGDLLPVEAPQAFVSAIRAFGADLKRQGS